MSDSKFTTHGDEPVEARIVAWVLGEASAFEAEELERLCEERPELAVFKRRIEAVHGLAKEAHDDKEDARWKLSIKKRAAIEELIGAEEEAAEDLARDIRAGRSGRRAMMAIAACLVMTLVVATLTWPVVFQSTKYAAANYGAESEQAYRWDDAATGDAIVLDEKKVSKTVSKKPSSPSNNVSRVITSAETSNVPVPEVEVEAPKVNFGADKDFGEGWGAGGGDRERLRAKGGPKVPTEIALSAPKPQSTPDAAPMDEAETGTIAGNSLSDYASRRSTGLKEGAERELFRKEVTRGESKDQAGFSGAPSSETRFYANEKWAEGLGGLDANGPAPAREPTPSVVPVVPPPSAPPVPAGRNNNSLHYEDGKTGQGQAQGEGQPGFDVANGGSYSRQTEKGFLGKNQAAPGGLQADPAAAYRKGLKDAPDVNYSFKDNQAKETDDFLSFGTPEKKGRSEDLDTSGEIDKLKVVDGLFHGDDLDHRDRIDAAKHMLAERGLTESTELELNQSLNKDGEFQSFLNAATGEQLGNLSALAKREMIRRQSDVAEADVLLLDGRKAYAEEDYASAVEKFKAALQAVPDAPLFEDRREVFESHLEDAEKALSERFPEDKEERKRPVVTEEEIIAADEPYSTFSLNINDASFRMAQAALAKGEMPDPEGIKVEQFYNAVDYGDPAPAQGQPVAGTIEQTAHPVIPGRNLVRVAIKTASEGRNQGQPLRLTLLIDQSGSMAREDRRQAMVDALEGLRGLLNENDQVNVIGFSRTPRLLAEAVNGKQGQLANLLNIEANEGGTNLEEALKLGEQLAERHQLEGAQNRVVLFTDGAANLGDADPDSLSDKIKELRQKGIAFDIAGIVADGLNDELLGEMARHGNGRYYVVGKGEKNRFAEQLAGAFRPAAENVKVQVHFNPERVGRYKLIGFEKDRLNKEDFHDDTVDAAEMAAEEAGVAIYQVETLPEGKGEIGEVSVRFRDVASGDMVERSWTISNEISTAALDQARPTMQLATLAMMAGEKLKGGPLADAINFNDMGEVIAKVQQHFKGDPKAAEMLEMIDQLK